MKFLTLLSVLFVSCAVFAQTYRSGGTRKANFGAQQAQQNEEKEKSSVPGANSGVKTRTFTNYGAKRAWSKGVQTKGVQTTTAGTPAPVQDDLDATPIPGAEKAVNAAVKKGAAAAQAPAAGGKGAPQNAQAQQPAMPAEAAAAMQQLQGMQDMMKGLGAAMPGGAAAGGAAGAPAAGMPAMPAGMPNIPGMPDMSALMGGAAAGQNPGKK